MTRQWLRIELCNYDRQISHWELFSSLHTGRENIRRLELQLISGMRSFFSAWYQRQTIPPSGNIEQPNHSRMKFYTISYRTKPFRASMRGGFKFTFTIQQQVEFWDSSRFYVAERKKCFSRLRSYCESHDECLITKFFSRLACKLHSRSFDDVSF